MPHVWGWKYNKFHTLLKERNVWYVCDPCKEKIPEKLGIEEKEELNEEETCREAGEEMEEQGEEVTPKKNNADKFEPKEKQQKKTLMNMDML